MLKKNFRPENIPFNYDPLTLILKDALVNKDSFIRMFVNISPSKFDTAVTKRSLEFAKQTGRIKTKIVDRSFLEN
jgi:hypothetical protein